MRIYSGIGLFSATILLFQVTLTRLFSVAQFYHFAFLVVSLALLGFGASGSLLAIFSALHKPGWRSLCALLTGPAALLAYLVINRWAFDSYAIAWDRAQIGRLLVNLLCLAIPFTFAGTVLGALLADRAYPVARIYGANMLGSAVGAALAPILLAQIGDERLVFLCGALAALASILLTGAGQWRKYFWGANVAGAVISLGLFVFEPSAFLVNPSPYKALSHFQRTPDATLEAPRYNAYSRLDIVRSPTIHSAPGLSMAYFNAPPPEIGLLIDGDNMLPAPQAASMPAAFARAMPASVAFSLYESPQALVLGAGGGLDIMVALLSGAQPVVGVEPNSLVYDALRSDLRAWTQLADDPRVMLVHQAIRTYARQSDQKFDVVQLALTDTYRPVTSGAFSLTENYTYTVEGFRDYLDLLRPDGLLIVTRWLQTPPSEEVRTLALILEALDGITTTPARHIIAFRSFQTITFLVKVSPFTTGEVAAILSDAEQRMVDMVLAPDLPPETINRYARLPEPIYHTTLTELLHTPSRATFYERYTFDVRPPTDNRPFFFHFFKWRQTPAILDNLGRTWQPFGGSGYFVLVALLLFASLFALSFIVLPVALAPRFRQVLGTIAPRQRWALWAYFGSLGLAYLMIEVGAMQQFVLILGHPTLAMATILGILLFSSGLGSLASNRLPWGLSLILLALTVAAWPVLIRWGAERLLAAPLVLRWLLTVAAISPTGFLMGIPFARGIHAIREVPGLTAWAWAINGSASVVSAVLAVLLALSYGFSWVFWAASALYGAAWLLRPSHLHE